MCMHVHVYCMKHNPPRCDMFSCILQEHNFQCRNTSSQQSARLLMSVSYPRLALAGPHWQLFTCFRICGRPVYDGGPL